MVRTVSRMTTAVALLAAALAVPAFASAQTFTVQKYDIKGQGGTDYLTAEPGTGRVFVSRGSHVMVVDGLTGNVLGDITDTPGMHGIALAMKEGHGFTTNGGDSTLSMFDLKDLHTIKKVHAGVNRLDGIMYDDFSKTILSINHSSPDGTAVVVDAATGDVKAKVVLSGGAPEGGVSDGKGHIYINLENKSAIDVIDAKTWTKIATWDIAPCEGPTGIAMDRKTNRIFAGCSGTSVVVDASTGKVVAQIKNGVGVDALGWDQNEKLIYIPAGQGDGSVTVVHDGRDVQGRKDDRRGRREAHRVPVPARVRPGAGTRPERSGSANRRPRARAEGADGGGVVYFNQALTNCHCVLTRGLLVG